MKKGFTLIEVLTVIVILAIILIIGVPQVLNAIESSKVSVYINNEKMLIKSTEVFLSKTFEEFPINNGETTEIIIDDLIQEGYLNDLRNPEDRTENCSGYILVTKINFNSYDYTPHVRCGNEINNSIDDNLLAHYKFNNNLYDYSLNGNHLTENVEVTFVNNRFNTSKSAVNLNTVDKYLLTKNDILLNGDFTISMFFKTNRTSNYRFLNNQSNYIHAFGFRNASTIAFWDPVRDGTLSESLTSEFEHLIITRENNNVKVYKSGNEISAFSWNGTLNINMLGGTPSNSGWTFFNGILDEIIIFERSFSNSELRGLYMSGFNDEY